MGLQGQGTLSDPKIVRIESGCQRSRLLSAKNIKTTYTALLFGPLVPHVLWQFVPDPTPKCFESDILHCTFLFFEGLFPSEDLTKAKSFFE